MATSKKTVSKTNAHRYVTAFSELISETVEPFELPDGRTVFFLPLSAGAVVDFMAESATAVDPETGKVNMGNLKDQQQAMLRLMSQTICDANGKLLMPDADIPQLRRIPQSIYNALQGKVTALIVEGNEMGKVLDSIQAEVSAKINSADVSSTAASPTASPSV